MQMHTMDLLLQPSHLLRDDLTLRQRQILYRGLMKNYCGNIYLKTTPRLFLKMIYLYFLRFHTINLINFKICLPDFFFLNIEFFLTGLSCIGYDLKSNYSQIIVTWNRNFYPKRFSVLQHILWKSLSRYN